jgi:hypothetical protein
MAGDEARGGRASGGGVIATSLCVCCPGPRRGRERDAMRCAGAGLARRSSGQPSPTSSLRDRHPA